jgi:hypothetical protein
VKLYFAAASSLDEGLRNALCVKCMTTEGCWSLVFVKEKKTDGPLCCLGLL